MIIRTFSASWVPLIIFLERAFCSQLFSCKRSMGAAESVLKTNRHSNITQETYEQERARFYDYDNHARRRILFFPLASAYRCRASAIVAYCQDRRLFDTSIDLATVMPVFKPIISGFHRGIRRYTDKNTRVLPTTSFPSFNKSKNVLGAHCTWWKRLFFVPREMLELSGADFGIQGEGEQAFRELIQA